MVSEILLVEKRFIEIISYRDTFCDGLRILGLVSRYDNMPKNTIPKENDSFNIFQDHFITNHEDLKCY